MKNTDIKTMRDSAGLTQKELAAKCGITQQKLSALEHGRYDGVSMRTIERIADGCGYAVVIVKK